MNFNDIRDFNFSLYSDKESSVYKTDHTSPNMLVSNSIGLNPFYHINTSMGSFRFPHFVTLQRLITIVEILHWWSVDRKGLSYLHKVSLPTSIKDILHNQHKIHNYYPLNTSHSLLPRTKASECLRVPQSSTLIDRCSTSTITSYDLELVPPYVGTSFPLILISTKDQNLLKIQNTSNGQTTTTLS